MAFTLVPPNTGQSLSTMDPASVRLLWQKTVDIFDQTEDFFRQYEGSSIESPICVKNDTAAGRGQTLTVTVRAGYYGEGKSGDQQFETTNDFETDVINHYSVVVDWLRNATAINERAEELMGMRDELANGSVAELGKWMGRAKTDRMFMLFRETGGPKNLLFAGNNPNQDSLLSANGLGYDDIVAATASIEPLGGRPALLRYDKNKNKIYRYNTISTTQGLLTLTTDSDFREILKEAGPRGEMNPLFTGEYYDVNGNIIRKYIPIDHDGNGPIGCALSPKALLGVAVLSTAVGGTSTSPTLFGGGNATYAADTTKLFFKHFGNYAYQFIPSFILTPGTGIQYVLIVNPRLPGLPAGGDGKIGMYSYTTGNNGNTIVTVNRLAAAAAGVAVTTLGAVVWDSGVWKGLHTDTHGVGATIIPCNQSGVPIGDTLMLGAAAAVRGYGKYRNKRSQWIVDGDFVTQRYITSVFGQNLRTNAIGVAPGYVRIRHAITYPGLGIPVVTSLGGQ